MMNFNGFLFFRHSRAVKPYLKIMTPGRVEVIIIDEENAPGRLKPPGLSEEPGGGRGGGCWLKMNMALINSLSHKAHTVSMSRRN